MITTAVTAIIVFGLLVFFHELGHFSVAKIVGIKVHEFAIGMGPKILKYTKGETDYSVRILPIGGYVKMEGEDEVSNDSRSFSKKTVGQRIAVIFAGPLMNFILAIVLFVIIFYNIAGVPTTTIQEVIDQSPAEAAGLLREDKIITINDDEVKDWDHLVQEINTSKGEPLKIGFIRDNKKIEKVVAPESVENEDRFMIGIIPTTEKSMSLAIKGSYGQTRMIIREMGGFFRRLVTRQATTAEVVGPVGIISLVGQASRDGLYNVLFLAALISINLGIVNLLPIPALDGSRILFLIFELFRGKPVDPEKEAFVHMIGLALLMLLMIIITYKDILTFIQG
ncbi:RIP metalloprotease RseP [Natronincola ferrireducens]|uniref:Zinc metalloprotease n=1 Tax=Natronincola ferrireducens TaxID=393762 RepID=A0A1G9C5A5_9FIRM|nr:RIP metalloprotease RseP [Natronincola ferrireducens]SDK46816.1 regulator of sigma E protease [Natronincola ferrireducens]